MLRYSHSLLPKVPKVPCIQSMHPIHASHPTYGSEGQDPTLPLLQEKHGLGRLNGSKAPHPHPCSSSLPDPLGRVGLRSLSKPKGRVLLASLPKVRMHRVGWKLLRTEGLDACYATKGKRNPSGS
jgi:hypothetical protein